MASRGRVFCKKSNYVVYKKIIGITDTCYLINVRKLFSNNEEMVCQSVRSAHRLQKYETNPEVDVISCSNVHRTL